MIGAGEGLVENAEMAAQGARAVDVKWSAEAAREFAHRHVFGVAARRFYIRNNASVKVVFITAWQPDTTGQRFGLRNDEILPDSAAAWDSS